MHDFQVPCGSPSRLLIWVLIGSLPKLGQGELLECSRGQHGRGGPWGEESRGATKLSVICSKGTSTWVGSNIWPDLAFLQVNFFFSVHLTVQNDLQSDRFSSRSIFFFSLFAHLGEHIKVLTMNEKPCKVALMCPAWLIPSIQGSCYKLKKGQALLCSFKGPQVASGGILFSFVKDRNFFNPMFLNSLYS